VLGQADVYLKSGPCSEWDTAAGQIMVEESGGLVFRQDNFEPLHYNKPSLLNPHFVMLSCNMNSKDFVSFIQTMIKNEK
jgi:3'(2'), 5'-bisphosphate nucleotidase